MPSPVPNNAAGIANSREKRSAKSVVHTNIMLAALLKLMREGNAGRTYKDLADRFNELKLPTARGGEWDAPLVGKLLDKLGASPRAHKRRFENRLRLALDAGKTTDDLNAENRATHDASEAARRARCNADGVDPDGPRDLSVNPFIPGVGYRY